MSRSHTLRNLLQRRPVVLDGGIGTSIQQCPTIPAPSPDVPVDLASLSKPTQLTAIHRQFLQAGADVITTNTFCANTIDLTAQGVEVEAETLNHAAVACCRQAIDEELPDEAARNAVFIAGSIGPTRLALSRYTGRQRDDQYQILSRTYRAQVDALQSGGVDILLLETFYDLHNLRAAVEAAAASKLPVLISCVADDTGRLPSGHRAAEVAQVIAELQPLAVGLNCIAHTAHRALAEWLPIAADLGAAAGFYPNAGLPEADGTYRVDADDFVRCLKSLVATTNVRLVGGCCGTTPQHIRRLAAAVRQRSY